jgi:tRNA-2-methylthio-N6-dimethylallyladenosine synthase
MISHSKHKFAKYFLPDQKKAKRRSFKKAEIIKSIFKLTPQLKKLGENKLAYIKTYGCQANIRDSETIIGILKQCSYDLTNDQTKADLIILNTCAIRENAEQKVFGELGHLKHAKKKKDVLIGVCGCMVQQPHVAKQLRSQTKHVDFVFGTHNIHMLPEILLSLEHNKRNFCVFSEEGKIYEDLPVTHTSTVKAFVNITYGCDKFCSYCVVPMVRGSLRSRKKEDIIAEVKQLMANGYKEVTLIGQNVNSYGIDLYKDYFFVDLLIDVAKTKIPRLRFTTCNP